MKEVVASGITKLVRADINNPILHTADGTDLCTVDQYELAAHIKALIDGGERLEAANIRR